VRTDGVTAPALRPAAAPIDLGERVATLLRRRRAGELSAAAFATVYFLQWQAVRHGAALAARRCRQDPKPDAAAWLARCDACAGDALSDFLADLLERYDLRLVRRRVPIALAAWLRGAWPITLCERVPSPREVLRMQADGTRPVTLIAQYPRMLQPVLDKPDAFAFLLHDLEHAYQFFRDATQHRAQRRFAAYLAAAVEAGHFQTYCRDPLFARKFDYLAADMNTHVIHSLQYLRAILVDYYLRGDGRAPSDALAPAARGAMQALWRALGGTWNLRDDALGALETLGAGALEARTAAMLASALAAQPWVRAV
jgi:hypothetical protein